jgi:putative RecB family exonuclease
MRLPERTSAAQLGLYATCPRKYRYKYIDEFEPEFKSVSLALGSAVHSAIQWFYDRRNNGCTTARQEIATIVRADLTAATDATTRYGKWSQNDLTKHAERLVDCFLDKYADLPVASCELRFDLELYDPETGETMPRPLVGYLDFVLRDGRVVELKTARSEYSEIDIAKNLQFGAYQIALEHLGVGDEMHVVAIIKNKSPRLQHVRLQRDERSRLFFLRAAADIERAILAGHFPPAPGMSCSGCEYQARCLGIAAHGQDSAA